MTSLLRPHSGALARNPGSIPTLLFLSPGNLKLGSVGNLRAPRQHLAFLRAGSGLFITFFPQDATRLRLISEDIHLAATARLWPAAVQVRLGGPGGLSLQGNKVWRGLSTRGHSELGSRCKQVVPICTKMGCHVEQGLLDLGGRSQAGQRSDPQAELLPVGHSLCAVVM